MKIKLETLDVIQDRAKTVREALGLKKCIRTPVSPVAVEDMPSIFIIEGPDTIIKRISSGLLYPVTRLAEVSIDLVIYKDDDYIDSDIYTKFLRLRTAILQDPDNLLPYPYGTFVRENRTEGPTGYGVYDVVVMRLVLDVTYNDDGT